MERDKRGRVVAPGSAGLRSAAEKVFARAPDVSDTGAAISGGWELTGLSLPAAGTIRARLRVTDGGRSTWFLEKQAAFTAPGLTPLEEWRVAHFGSPANSGNGANDFDFDGDGLTNLAEYAWGLDPANGASNQTPAGAVSGNHWSVEFTSPAGVAGVTYSAEWSLSLAAGSWTAIADSGSGALHRFEPPLAGMDRVFVRLTVRVP